MPHLTCTCACCFCMILQHHRVFFHTLARHDGSCQRTRLTLCLCGSALSSRFRYPTCKPYALAKHSVRCCSDTSVTERSDEPSSESVSVNHDQEAAMASHTCRHCSNVYQPVCANKERSFSSAVTFDNICLAICNGFRVSFHGACPSDYKYSAQGAQLGDASGSRTVCKDLQLFDKPWRDREGDTCFLYTSTGLCNRNGTYGNKYVLVKHCPCRSRSGCV